MEKEIILLAFFVLGFLSASYASAQGEGSASGEGIKYATCFPEYTCGAWSSCEGGLQTRVCVDKKCNNRDIVERKLCERPSTCVPDIQCGDWSECIYTDKTTDFFTGKIIFGGYRTRVCEDRNGCVERFEEEGVCSEVVKLELVKRKICDNEFLVAVEPKTKREVAKINLDRWRDGQIGISFLVGGESGYCPSCFNGVQDNDETGIDCGGSCRPCSKKKESQFKEIVALSSWLGFLIFSSLLAYAVVKQKSRKLKRRK
ncbi:hypothetical protein D6817_05350 [Candidatus Pacearchaeota archaeon]|nr:MAG: hypothetical protein D6817_05350 [Candidatus Pacearchaeota archaeon]